MMTNYIIEWEQKRIELEECFKKYQTMIIKEECQLRELKFLQREINSLMEDIYYLECVMFVEGGC